METIKLKYPIEVAGEKITNLNLRRVTVGDLELMNKESDELGKSIRLLSLIGEVAPEDVRKLDAHDFSKASEVVADFWHNCGCVALTDCKAGRGIPLAALGDQAIGVK